MRLVAGAFVCWALIASGACGGQQRSEAFDAALRDILATDDAPAFVTEDDEGRHLWTRTQAFYGARDMAPAWLENAAPTARVEALVEALRAGADEGLDPQLYRVDLIEDTMAEGSRGFLTPRGFEPAQAATFEVWLTYLYMKFATDLADGLSDLAGADPHWRIQVEPLEPDAHLEEAVTSNRIAESLRELVPDHREYRALRDAFDTYRALAANGGWPTVPSDLRLAPGEEHPAVGTLAARLAATGDYAGHGVAATADDVPQPFGEDLQEGVKRFQARHGLPASGRVDAATVAALNVPVEERVQQIAFNLERWRWVPRDLGDRYILVNIPEMQLRLYEGDAVALAMRVVVGTDETQTPIFNDQMTYLVFSPYWNVPDSIAQGETLPAALRDASYLARNSMEIVDRAGRVVDPETLDENALENYRFRQRPGATNALGLVKFMFPNEYNVYLHDTPADTLFTRASRAFSHGCVRLEEPEALAEYLLRDQPEWTAETIRTAMQRGREQTVTLTDPIPVYLGYWTASVDEHGVLQFLPDVYGIDAGQQQRLASRLERLSDTATPAVE